MRLRRRGNRRADRTITALGKAPGAEHAVELAHVVMQEHISGARRARAEQRADDAARRLRALQRLALEPFVEIVGRAHGEELPQRVEILLRQSAEIASEPQEIEKLARIERCRIGRRRGKERLHRTRHAMEEQAEFVVGLGVARRVARELAAVLVVIRPLREIVPAR